MDRLTRHELKSDKFVQEVGQTVHFLEEHKQQTLRYAGIVLAVLVLAGAGYFLMKSRAADRQAALHDALETYNARVMPDNPPEGIKAFRTQQERQAAVEKELGLLNEKYSGSEEASVATYLLGVNAADQGKLADAERYLKLAIEDSDKNYASLARQSLAEIYASQGKTADAEAQLRAVIANPTVLVSKEQATISLAKIIARTKPEEAKKLLEPLRTVAGPVSRAAIQAYAEIGQAK